jgi:hypothetical protein
MAGGGLDVVLRNTGFCEFERSAAWLATEDFEHVFDSNDWLNHWTPPRRSVRFFRCMNSEHEHERVVMKR